MALLLMTVPVMAAESQPEIKPAANEALVGEETPEIPAPEIMGRYGRLEFAGVFPAATRGKDFPETYQPKTSISASSGIGFGAAFGYQFDNIWAVELAVNHRYFTVSGTYDSSSPIQNLPGLYQVNFKSSVNSVTVIPTLRVGYDVIKDIRLTGSLGMGISNNVTNVRESHQPNNNNWRSPYTNGDYWNHDGMSWTSFVWSIGVGAEYRLTEKLFITTDANYIRLGEMHWSERWRNLITGQGGAERTLTPYKISAFESRIGLGYRF